MVAQDLEEIAIFEHDDREEMMLYQGSLIQQPIMVSAQENRGLEYAAKQEPARPVEVAQSNGRNAQPAQEQLQPE